MSRKLDDLRDDAKVKAYEFIADMKERGEIPVVTSTVRSDVEQLAMFAQGRAQLEVVNALRMMAGLPSLPRSENTHIISNCDGQTTRSAHQDGRAFDVVLLDSSGKPIWNISGTAVDRYKILGTIGKSHNLTWGGDFKPLDPITGLGWDAFHFEV